MTKKFILSLLVTITICLLVFVAANLNVKPELSQVPQNKSATDYASLADVTLIVWVTFIYFRK